MFSSAHGLCIPSYMPDFELLSEWLYDKSESLRKRPVCLCWLEFSLGSRLNHQHCSKAIGKLIRYEKT